MKTVEIEDKKYRVSYGPMSYIKLKQEYGFDIKQGELAELANEENPNMTGMIQFVTLGLIGDNSKADVERALSASLPALLEKMEFFVEAWAESMDVQDLVEEAESDAEAKKEE